MNWTVRRLNSRLLPAAVIISRNLATNSQLIKHPLWTYTDLFPNATDLSVIWRLKLRDSCTICWDTVSINSVTEWFRADFLLLFPANLLKLWLNTQNAKKTADNGNSFGNDLQRRVTEDSKSLENYLSTVFIRFTHQQIPKHPFRRDLGETSADVDAPVEIMGETEYRVLRSILIRVRDSYLDLHDLLKRHREQKSNSAE